MKEQALKYLSKNPLLHISMTEPLRLGRARLLKASPHGVLLEVLPENIPMLSADNLEAGMDMLEGIHDTGLIVVHQEFLVEPVKQKYGLTGANICDQAVYTKKEPLPIPQNADIRLLDESYCEIMAAHYHLSNDPEHMRELIKSGVMHGIFVEDNLAGFMGMHSEGSMGLLEIFPEYQNRGLGTILQKYMINFVLAKGGVPFGQVIVGNKESMGLQHKLGMEIARGKVTWIFGQK